MFYGQWRMQEESYLDLKLGNFFLPPNHLTKCALLLIIFNFKYFQILRFNVFHCYISVGHACNKITYNDFFLNLKSKGLREPRSVESNRYVLLYNKEKYNSDNWKDEYENIIFIVKKKNLLYY